MVAVLLFFVASYLNGLTLTELFKLEFTFTFRSALAVILGTIFNTIFIFFISHFGGFNFLSISTFLIINLVICSVYLANHKEFLDFEKINLKTNYILHLAFLLIVLIVAVIFIKSIYVSSDNITAGNRLVWTDWPIHIAIISSFVYGNNFPPQNPHYSGELITYPFFSDFLSAILQKLGANIKISIVFPSIVLSVSSLILLIKLGSFITKSFKVSMLGLAIGVFWGGIGFIYFFQDLINSPNFLEVLTFPAKEYTFYQEKNLWFFTFLYSELLAQRAFLFGLPMFLTSLLLAIRYISSGSKSSLILSALTISVMPFFHFHSYIAIILFLAGVLLVFIFTFYKAEGLKQTRKKIIEILSHFLLPIVGFGLIQLPLFLSVNVDQTINFQWGWMKGEENFILFWLKNTGPFIPLMLLAYPLLKKESMIVKSFFFSSLILFIVPNLLTFASWPYDNLKIFTYWYLFGAFFVANVLVFIIQKIPAGRIISIVLFITLILSGSLEIIRIVNTQKTTIALWNQSDFDMAQVILENTQPNAKILTAAIHDHPASALAGRQQIIGFPGNAWTWGKKDWSQREQDVRALLRGDENRANFIINKYKLDYAILSSREKYFEQQTNEHFFDRNFEIISAGPNFKLYKLNAK